MAQNRQKRKKKKKKKKNDELPHATSKQVDKFS